MYKHALALAVALTVAPAAFAANYAVDTAKSQVGFSGTHTGNAFKGTFNKWQARFSIDPKKLKESCIEATFDLASAATGNPMYDGTLPTVDWFDVKNHPQGRFVSTAIKANTDGTYTADGNLTLRGVTKPTHFKFTLDDKLFTSKDTLVIDRLAYGIGAKSDPKAEWVGKDIGVQVNVVAPVTTADIKANCK